MFSEVLHQAELNKGLQQHFCLYGQNLDLQLEAAHRKAAMAEAEIREAVAGEMEELLRDMEASYKVRAHSARCVISASNGCTINTSRAVCDAHLALQSRGVQPRSCEGCILQERLAQEVAKLERRFKRGAESKAQANSSQDQTSCRDFSLKVSQTTQYPEWTCQL